LLHKAKIVILFIVYGLLFRKLTANHNLKTLNQKNGRSSKNSQ